MPSLREKYSFPTIAPSILAADFTELGNEIQKTSEGGARWIHCDIMDGHFVPNISYGPMIVDAAHKANPDSFLDVHLMIYNPSHYIQPLKKAGASLISVHIEADQHIHRTLHAIKDEGMYCGVAINPSTSVVQIEEILPIVDLVCVMSVNPGFGGQKFIPEALSKIQRLAEWRRQMDLSFLIEIDGGVGLGNTTEVAASGTDVLVAGSSIFKAENIKNRTEDLFRKAIIGQV